MKKSWLVLILFIILLIVLFLQLKSRNLINNSTKTSFNKTSTVLINKSLIKVEIADDDLSREKGLSGRDKLDENYGMLFTFDKKDVMPIFWMKGMLIPIDIIWINDGAINKIDANVPPPDSTFTPDSQLTIYPAIGPTDYVLEVDSGFCQKNNIKVGDNVIINL